MPYGVPGGTGGGGSGFHLGEEPNNFDGANEAAALNALYAQSWADADWLESYTRDETAIVTLSYGGGVHPRLFRGVTTTAPAYGGFAFFQSGTTGYMTLNDAADRNAFVAAVGNSAQRMSFVAEGRRYHVLTAVAVGGNDRRANITFEQEQARTGAFIAASNYELRLLNWADVASVAVIGDQRDSAIDTRIAARVKPYARTSGPLIAGSDADPAFLLESEVTRAFLLNLLGLTPAQIEALFVGAAKQGSNIVITQLGGATITLPVDGGGGGADGVVTAGSYNPVQQGIDLTISTGGTVHISLGVLIGQISQGQPPPVPATTGADVRYELLIDASGQSRWAVAGSSGGGGGPVTYPTLYFGTSADRDPTAAELTVQGVQGAGEIAAYAGERHVLVARLASEGDLSRITRSDDGSGTNQLGAFTKHGSTVNRGGSAFTVYVSNQALSQAANVTWSAS